MIELLPSAITAIIIEILKVQVSPSIELNGGTVVCS